MLSKPIRQSSSSITATVANGSIDRAICPEVQASQPMRDLRDPKRTLAAKRAAGTDLKKKKRNLLAEIENTTGIIIFQVVKHYAEREKTDALLRTSSG